MSDNKTIPLPRTLKHVTFKSWRYGGPFHYLDEISGVCMCGMGVLGDDGKIYNHFNFGFREASYVSISQPREGRLCSSCERVYDRSVDMFLTTSRPNVRITRPANELEEKGIWMDIND